jgi:hypothetical protein
MTTTEDFVTARMWAERHGLRDVRQDGKPVPPNWVLLTNNSWVTPDEAERIERKRHDSRVTELRSTVRAHKASIRAVEQELKAKRRQVADIRAHLATVDLDDSSAVCDVARQLIAAVNNRDQLVGHLTGTRTLLQITEDRLAATSKDD